MGNRPSELRLKELDYKLAFLVGEVTQQSVSELSRDLILMSNDDIQKVAQLKNFSTYPISLYINSYGGEAYSALGLYDIIKTSTTPIDTYAIGSCMSSGFIIFLAGEKRYAFEHTTFLIHNISASAFDSGRLQDIEESYHQMTKLDSRFEKIIIENTKITAEMMKDIKSRKYDWFISAEEALELGIIHEIVTIDSIQDSLSDVDSTILDDLKGSIV